jgi:hypothetical protein
MLAVMIAATGHDDILMGLGLIFLLITLARTVIHRRAGTASAVHKSRPERSGPVF